MSRSPKVLFSIVCYGNYEEVQQFGENLLAQENPGVLLIITDNTSSAQKDQSPLEVVRNYPDRVLLLERPDNPGYYAAAAMGVLTAQRQGWLEGLPEWLVICNTDLSFSLPELLQCVQGRPPSSRVVLAPSIWDERGHRQLNPYLRERPHIAKLWLIYIASLAGPTYDLMLAYSARSRPRDRANDGELMYAPHGSFAVFSAACLERQNLCRLANCRLYSEEYTVGEMCRRSGIGVAFAPGVEVVHEGSSVTGKLSGPERRRAVRRGVRAGIRLMRERA